MVLGPACASCPFIPTKLARVQTSLSGRRSSSSAMGVTYAQGLCAGPINRAAVDQRWKASLPEGSDSQKMCRLLGGSPRVLGSQGSQTISEAVANRRECQCNVDILFHPTCNTSHSPAQVLVSVSMRAASVCCTGPRTQIGTEKVCLCGLHSHRPRQVQRPDSGKNLEKSEAMAGRAGGRTTRWLRNLHWHKGSA